jgi:hypothetical protein|tara:strand:- start:7 stop:1029 length:1023 start_codon:yes stop_codon:yes gene_type:complete
MAFKSSRGRDLGKELEIFTSNKIGQGLGSGGGGGGNEATGGVTFTGPIYKYHIFTSSGTFNVTSGTIIAQIVASGGGGGGSGYGPGYYVGTNGADSVLTTPVTEYRAAGGGGGTRYTPGTAQPGGSGGGGGAPSPPYAPAGTGQKFPNLPSTPAPLRGQNAPDNAGNPGGQGIGVYMGGGGGGAGATGQNATPSKSGDGGIGIALFDASADIPSDYGETNPGSPGRWVCGGGGGSGGSAIAEGVGGIGGGGNGRGDADTNVPNSKGQVNTGGGGGAFNNSGGGGSGGGGAGGYYDSGLGPGFSPGTYPVVIGSGGAGAPDSHPDPGGQGGSGFLMIRYLK